jgi:hypothetical protein
MRAWWAPFFPDSFGWGGSLECACECVALQKRSQRRLLCWLRRCFFLLKTFHFFWQFSVVLRLSAVGKSLGLLQYCYGRIKAPH